MIIGFIGLGNMGYGMALNLLEQSKAEGNTLIVLDIKQDVVAGLVAKGATDGKSVVNMCPQCDVLFTSLPSSKEVNLLAFGEEGILSNLKEGATWFETSTNELAKWEKIKIEAPEHLTLVDGPVSGGAEGALAGTLATFLGIDEDVLAKFESLLSAFAARIVRMGPSGAGYVTKLAQLHLNYLVAQGIGETLMMGAKAKLDLTTLHSVLMSSCARSYVVESYIPKVLDGSYDNSFALGLAEKDMRLITELSHHLGVSLPLGEKVYDTYQEATKAYGFDAPHLSVVRLMEESHGQLLRS